MARKPMYSAEERQNFKFGLWEKFKSIYHFWIGPNKKKLPEPIVPDKAKALTASCDPIAQLPIEEPAKSILCGTIFADSSIKLEKNYRNARIQNRHSTRQSTWFFWKWLVALETYVTGISAITFQEPDGYQKRSETVGDEKLAKLHLKTKAHPHLTKLNEILAPKGEKILDRLWLNHMTSYFLMVTWCDDGSLNHSYQGCICLDAAQEEKQQVFCDYLLEIWGIAAHVQWQGDYMRDGRKRYRVFLSNQESLLNLLRIVAPLIPVKEMLYKVFFVPKHNLELLQRWASEIEGLVQPELREYVKEFYAQALKEHENLDK